MDTKFEGGVNIAIKIPKRKYEETVAFYRDVLKLEVEEQAIDNPTVSQTHQVKFGNNVVWLDCVDNYAHPQVWLELKTNAIDEATAYLKRNGTETCDELEQIPENMHWITDPAGTVLILNEHEKKEG
jgi:predicted enzyme related to lactoylglutathione lyase